MLFSSTVFFCFFLPGALIGYYLFLRKSRTLQNIFLFVISILFYGWGEPKYVLIILASIFMNWLFGICIDKCKDTDRTKIAEIILMVTVIYNVSILFVFKYLNFTVSVIDSIFDVGLKIKEIELPIGISFFTFQAMSYVIDVYRNKGKVQKNLLNVGLYIAFFPQLIAGPIVRYETVSEEILHRKETPDDFFAGFSRFIEGFCKKVLLANTMAKIADYAFNTVHNGGEVSVLTCWLGAVCYALQIYYDFGGYSDMAIGLGKMFGFHFLENFNYPYISTSITDFWRRWHISLGSWFRDYVYIPLGGSRVSKERLVFNLLVVWLLTGIWHGANWTFIIWGLMYFILLAVEKMTAIPKKQSKNRLYIWRLYTLFFVLVGWVVFRADTIGDAVCYLQHMVGIRSEGFIDAVFMRYLSEYVVFLIAAVLFSVPIVPLIRKKCSKKLLLDILYVVGLSLLFLIAFSGIVSNAYNPFIYFNF